MQFRACFTVGIVGALLAAACASPNKTSQLRSSPSIDAYGISMDFPAGWDARISYAEGTPGPIVEAATFALPQPGPDAMYLATHSMAPNEVILALHEYTDACPCEGFEEISSPLSIGRDDFTAWQGLDETHSLATRSFVISGRSFELWVNFSSKPVADVTLDQLNGVLASLMVGDSAGDPSPPQANTWIPPTFGPASDWNVASTGPVPTGSEALTETWAANVPFRQADLRESALASQLVWPQATMKSLSPEGAIMVASIDDPEDTPASPSPDFPARDLPLQLSDAQVQNAWEGQVAPNVPFYLVTATLKDQYVEVRIFFGSQDPSPSTLQAAQDELDRLVVPDLRALPAPTAQVVATIPVGQYPSAIAVGGGSVWVAVRGEDSSESAVVRIDPATDEVAARIPVDAVPGWDVGGGGLAFDDDTLWVAGRNDAGGVIDRIDTSTNRVVDAIHVDGDPADVATFASGFVWVLLRGDTDSPRLLQIDASTHEVVSTTDLPGAYGRRLINAGGQMFAMVVTPVGGPYDDCLLYHLDAWTGAVKSVFDVGAYAPIAASVGQVWAATGNSLIRIDPQTGQPFGDPAPVVNTGDAVAVGDGGVWFFGPNDRTPSRYNPVSDRVDVSVPGTGDGIAIATDWPNAIWVANHRDSVTRIDLS